jgi:hypothetical protein
MNYRGWEGEFDMDELHWGSFAAGQAAAEVVIARPNRYSLGQERRSRRADRTTGSFPDGQARTHPAPVPRGRFCTGQISEM